MMPLFGPAHLAIMAATLVVLLTLIRFVRRRPPAALPLRLVLGWGLVVNELVWYVFRYSHEGFRFPEGLPLQLCDITLWLTAIACITLNRTAAEFAYFAGAGGAAMAIVTPDLWAPLWSYPTLYFFLAHGGVVVASVLLVAGRLVTLEPGCVWRAFATLNIYGAAAGAFNATFGTNYLYLCRKPAGASLLDLLGPWPVYIIAGELMALGIFTILWLPVKHVGRDAAASAVRTAPA